MYTWYSMSYSLLNVFDFKCFEKRLAMQLLKCVAKKCDAKKCLLDLWYLSFKIKKVKIPNRIVNLSKFFSSFRHDFAKVDQCCTIVGITLVFRFDWIIVNGYLNKLWLGNPISLIHTPSIANRSVASILHVIQRGVCFYK